MNARFGKIATEAFPVWVLVSSCLALYKPQLFIWFRGNLIPFGLAMIMLGMGLTLTFEDFKRIGKFPGRVLSGFILQYTIMPFLGWSLGYAFQLPPFFAAGLVLVACCPGGTASNVVTYLAKADVPLSVTMTAASTLFAVVMTPALTSFLVGSRVEVSFWGLLSSTLQVVILPIIAGALMNRFFKKITATVLPLAPLVAVFFITLIVASIVGQGRDLILESGARLILAVFSLHAGGFLLGYISSKVINKDEMTARTVSIEVGMQNSGLGVVLAQQNFTSPAVAIPSAISSVFHSLIGSLLAAYWRKKI
jgi:bile acid:Na+ symporter, BASS family